MENRKKQELENGMDGGVEDRVRAVRSPDKSKKSPRSMDLPRQLQGVRADGGRQDMVIHFVHAESELDKACHDDLGAKVSPSQIVRGQGPLSSPPKTSLASRPSTERVHDAVGINQLSSPYQTERPVGPSTRSPRNLASPIQTDRANGYRGRIGHGQGDSGSAQIGLYGQGYATGAGSKMSLGKTMDKMAMGNSGRPYMSTSKSTSGISLSGHPNAHAINMPLALSTATLALNSPQLVQPAQPIPQHTLGLISHPVGHSLSLNDSLSTINQSITNVNTLLPCQTAPPSTAATPSTTEQYMQVNEIRKEMRRKEQEYQKQVALLKQKVQLLEMQEREFKHREDKMRRNHESMLRAFQAGAGIKGDGGVGERQSVTEIEQVKQMRDEYESENAQLARKVTELEEVIKGKDYQYNSLIVQSEEKDIEAERKVYELQLDKRNLENQIKRLENELVKAENMEKATGAAGTLASEASVLRSRLEQERNSHKEELGKQLRCVKELQEQKACQAQQLEFLQTQLNQKESQRTADRSQIEQLEDQVKTFERQFEEMEQQIEESTMQLASKDQVIQGMHQQIQNLLHQQSQSQQISLDLGSSIEEDFPAHSLQNRNDGNSSPKRANLMENQRLADENEYLNEQIRSQKQIIKSQQEQIKKYQGTEDLGQLELKENQQKVKELSTEVAGMAEELKTEQERSQMAVREQMSLQQQIQSLKAEFEEQRCQQEQILQERQQQIERLQQELQENVNSFSMHHDARAKEHSWGPTGTAAQQSPIRFQNVSTLMASREFQQTLINGMQLQQQVQKSHQSNQQVQQNISVISSGVGGRQQHNMQASHLNVSEDVQSKVFSSVAQSQKQIIDPLGSGDQLPRQYQPQDGHQPAAEGFQTTEDGHPNQATNNATLNLNISNYQGSIAIVNNDQINGDFLRQQQAYQASVEAHGIPEGYDEKQRMRQGAQQPGAGRAQQEASAPEYMSYVAQFDLPRQNDSLSHAQSHTHCEVAEHHFEDTLDEQDRKWVPASELDLLQSCQKIIDAALSMKCSQCLRIFPTTDFYDHIIVRRECIIETEGNLDTSANEQAAEEPSQLLETEQFQQLYQQPTVSQSYEESGIRGREGQEEEMKGDVSAEQSLEAEREAGTSSKIYEALNMPLQLKPSEIERSYATQIRTNSAAAGAMTAHKVEQTVFSGPRVGGIGADKEQPPNECDDASSSQVHSVQHTAHNANRQTQRLLSGQKATVAAQKRLSSLSPFGQMQSSHRSGASKIGAQSTAAQGNKSKRYRHHGGAQGASFGQTAINSFGHANGASGTAATGACAQGYGSRSGMGLSRGTGMTGTVHSHILMSLSRTESSRSAFSGKEIEDADPAFPKAQPNGQPSNAANFSNDQDNIKYLAANYHDQSGHLLHHLHMQNYTDQNLITESAQTMNDPAAILAITDTNLSQTNLSRLGHVEPPPAPGPDRGSTARMSQDSGADGQQNDEDQAAAGRQSQTDEEMQNNMLSQSLRDIVNNQEMPGTRAEGVEAAAGMDTMIQSMNNRDSTSPNMKGHLPHPIQEDIVTSLEKLYDLDTSRFEEEYSNLPSVKKKILLKQLVEDEVNFGDEQQDTEDCPYGGDGSDEFLGQADAVQHVASYHTTDKAPEGSAQQSKFVDISRFNYSLPQIDGETQKIERPEHFQDQGSTGQSQSNQVRVVGLNLAPIIARQKQQEPLVKQAAAKPKFDLTKKFNEMNIKKDVGQKAQTQSQKKAAGSQRRATSQKNASKGSSRQSSQRKQMAKKNLNIDVESTEGQETRKACTSAANARGGPDGNWQGKLNLDLAKVTAQGHPAQQQPSQVNGLSGQQQATSRRQGAPLGSNRYSKRGILLPDSSSYTSSPESYPQQDQSERQPPQEMVAGACSKQALNSRQKQPSSVKNTQVQPSQLLNNDALKSPQASRLAAGRGVSKTGAEDGAEDKTVEQPGTRQLHHTVKFLSTLNCERQPNAHPTLANRLDSSGFDINFGSEVHSPLSKKMHMNATGTAPHETGLLKLKSTNFSKQQISEEELRQHNLLYTTMQDGNQLQGRPQDGFGNDRASEVLVIRDQKAKLHGFEHEGEVYDENAGSILANTHEGINQGMESHRHQLGKQRGFVPTLMADQEQKQYEATHPQQASRRDVGQLTESERHLARRILGAQLSLQSTSERRQQPPSKPLPPSSNAASNSSKPIISTLQFQNPQMAKQALLLQRQSPTKNSDYIRRSILLSHRSAGTAGNKTKRGEDVDCPSVYDDKEFDEECAQIGNEEHVPATSNDTRGKLPLNGSWSQKPKEKPLTRRDPLKNSLFHNFKVQTQRLHQPSRTGAQGGPGGGHQPGKHTFTDKHAVTEELSGRPGSLHGAQSQKELAYALPNAADSRVNQNTSWYTNVRGQTSTQLAIQSPNDFVSYHTSGAGQQKQGKGGLQKNKSLSQLQQHLSQTAQLQRGRGNPKRLVAEAAAMQHSNFATANPGISLRLHPTNTSALTSLSQAPHLPCISPLSVSNLSLQQPHLQQAYLDQVPGSTLALPTASHRHPAKPLLYFNESEPSYSDAKPNPTTRLPRSGHNPHLDESADSHQLERRQGQPLAANAAALKESPALRAKSNSVFAPHVLGRQAVQQPTQGQQQMRIQQEWRRETRNEGDIHPAGSGIGSHLAGSAGSKGQRQAAGSAAAGARRGADPRSHR